MTPEEQLQLADTLFQTLKDDAQDVRKEALHCLMAIGTDGLGRVIDCVEDDSVALPCKIDAIEAIGRAFSEGKVDRSSMVKSAVGALEKCIDREHDGLCEAAISSLGEIGPQAINAKPHLLKLLDEKKENNRLRVKISHALLRISPVH
jgi:hypothetical protein